MASSASVTDTRTPRRRRSRTNRCRLRSIWVLQGPAPGQALGERAAALPGRDGADPGADRGGRRRRPVVVVVVPPGPVLGGPLRPGPGVVAVVVGRCVSMPVIMVMVIMIMMVRVAGGRLVGQRVQGGV